MPAMPSQTKTARLQVAMRHDSERRAAGFLPLAFLALAPGPRSGAPFGLADFRVLAIALQNQFVEVRQRYLPHAANPRQRRSAGPTKAPKIGLAHKHREGLPP